MHDVLRRQVLDEQRRFHEAAAERAVGDRHADGSLLVGLVVMAAAILVAAFVSYRLVAAGWRLTS